MTNDYLPYSRQFIDSHDIKAVSDVLKSDFLTTGPVVEAFEDALSDQFNGASVMVCSSGTAALHLAALSLELDINYWAIVPAITFVATANAIRYTGGNVIFCDVDPNSGLMTADTFEEALSRHKEKSVGAVLPVHLAGQPAAPEQIFNIANSRGIKVIEDGSHALGTSYKGHNDNSYNYIGECMHCDLATFSFHPVKTIACGEGGAVATRSPEMAEKLKRLRSHGIVRSLKDYKHKHMALDNDSNENPWYYEMQNIGYNYRLSDLHAALGLSQLSKLDTFLKKRRQLVKEYDKYLTNISPLIKPLGRVRNSSVGWHLYPVLIDFETAGVSRSVVMNKLKMKGIGTQVHYIPVPFQPYYEKYCGKQTFYGAEKYYSQTLSLPLFTQMNKYDVERVVTTLSECLKE